MCLGYGLYVHINISKVAPMRIFEKPKGNPILEDELREVESGELHNTNLYDQNEDPNGDKVDLGTGQAIDNTSIERESEMLTGVSADELFSNNDEQSGDAADQWLRENDPDLI